MQLKQLKIGHWYQTKYGIGKCIGLFVKSGNFEIVKPEGEVLGRPVRLGDHLNIGPKEVQYEIPKGNEPHAGEELPATMLDVLEMVKKHIDELADAWQRGAIKEPDGQGGTRSNRNADVARLLEKCIAREKGTPS